MIGKAIQQLRQMATEAFHGGSREERTAVFKYEAQFPAVVGQPQR